MYLVYSQQKQLGSGTLTEAARIAKEHSESAGVIVFDGTTFQPVDLDLSGSLEQVVAKANSIPTPENTPRRRGRPKLGVVSREVTLLPRHWEWLADQPGGISAAIRRLVANARKDPEQQKKYAKQLATEKGFVPRSLGTGLVTRKLFEPFMRTILKNSYYKPKIGQRILRVKPIILQKMR